MANKTEILTAAEYHKKFHGKIELPKPTANALTKQALAILTYIGFKVWRQNNGGVFDPTKKVFRSGSSTPGVSDIIGFRLKDGKFFAGEVKGGKDKLSPAQESFLAAVQSAGGFAVVIRTMDDVEQLKMLK